MIQANSKIEARQWFPDPYLGEYEGGVYTNRRIGYDRQGVTYTVTEVGVGTRGRGFVKIYPGDWLVTLPTGTRLVVADEDYRALFPGEFK